MKNLIFDKFFPCCVTFDVLTSSLSNQPGSRGFFLSLSTAVMRLKIQILKVLTQKAARNFSVVLLWINYWCLKANGCLTPNGLSRWWLAEVVSVICSVHLFYSRMFYMSSWTDWVLCDLGLSCSWVELSVPRGAISFSSSFSSPGKFWKNVWLLWSSAEVNEIKLP